MKTTYYTCDNGGRPFKVVFDPTNRQCKIFKIIDENLKRYSSIPIKVFSYQKAFIGKSPYFETKKKHQIQQQHYGPEYDGNSILLHIKDNIYVFIGESIYQFYSDEIKKFVSPVGNSEVPYPYAITNKDIHLLLEGKTIQKTKYYNKFKLLNYILSEVLLLDKNNPNYPYHYYYADSDISEWHDGSMIMPEISYKLNQEEYKTVKEQYAKTIRVQNLRGKKIIINRLT